MMLTSRKEVEGILPTFSCWRPAIKL